MAAIAAISGARMRRESRKTTEERRATPLTLCPCGRAPRKNAALRRLHPPRGAAAVQRGEKRIQGGSRGNSQSPYPSLAAGGCHKAAAAAQSGARTLPRNPQSNGRTQSTTYTPCNNGRTRRESRKATAERISNLQIHKNRLRRATISPQPCLSIHHALASASIASSSYERLTKASIASPSSGA